MIIKVIIVYFLIASWNVANEVSLDDYCTDDGCPSFYNEEDKDYYADTDSKSN